jgi:hypothetical protein
MINIAWKMIQKGWEKDKRKKGILEAIHSK